MLLVFDELMYLPTGKYWNVSHIWCICLLESTEMHLVIFLVKMLLVIDIILYSKVLKMLPYFDKNVYCKVLKCLWWCEKECIDALYSLHIVKSNYRRNVKQIVRWISVPSIFIQIKVSNKVMMRNSGLTMKCIRTLFKNRMHMDHQEQN